MKKHNDGYALLLVLVVMIVLTTIVTSVLSLSLQNMKAQQRSIENMQDKYSAQGAVEQVVAMIEDGFTFELGLGGNVKTELSNKVKDICKKVNEEAATAAEDEISGDGLGGTKDEIEEIQEFTITSQFKSVTVTCHLKVKWKIVKTTLTSEKSTCEAKAVQVQYLSYDITRTESDSTGITSTEPATGGATE